MLRNEDAIDVPVAEDGGITTLTDATTRTPDAGRSAARDAVLLARALLAGGVRQWPLLLVVLVAVAAVGQRPPGEMTVAPVVAVGVASATAYVVACRWGCWRWVAALAVVPAWLALDAFAGLDWRGSSAIALAAAAIAVACWRAGPTGVTWLAGGLTLVVAVALGASATTLVEKPFEHLDVSVPLAVSLVVVAVAAGGLGRAHAVRPLRLACVVALVAPLPFVALTAPAGLVAITWWPAAAAVGLTGLLRGARGPGAVPPPADEVDSAVLAEVADRWAGRRLAPVTVVIAAYNEVVGLPAVLDSLPSELCGLPVDVLVVDDGSSDGTAESIAGSGALVASCPVNRGQGAALRLGYRLAREHGARYIVTTDADGQYDAADLPRLLAPILAGDADFVTGSRILGHQHTFDRVRRAGVHVFSRLATLLTGQHLTDTSFGLRAMRAEVTAAVALRRRQYQSSELLLGAISHGFRVREVPGTMHLRSAGTSKKGRNLTYGSHYARAMVGTWWREGCPRPITEQAPALRRSGSPQSGTTATPRTDWPNGGTNRRSTKRVTGTTKRS